MSRIRCRRCTLRPPLPGLQSRAWSRELETPLAPGRPAQPGPRPAPASSPGEQCPRAPSGLGRDPEPAIDWPHLSPDSGSSTDRPPQYTLRLGLRAHRPRHCPDSRLLQSPPPFPLRPGLSSLLPRPFPPSAGPPLSLSNARPLPTSSPIPLLPRPPGSDPFRGWPHPVTPSLPCRLWRSPPSPRPHPNPRYLYETRDHFLDLLHPFTPPQRSASPPPTSPQVQPLPSASLPGQSSHPPSSHRGSDQP